MINFVAIDFETANSQRDSACALGAVLVQDGKIIDRRYTLINPNVPFHYFCTQIHGILEEDVSFSPTFSDIYPMLFKMLDKQVVVAHNASFDIAVLKASCENRHLPMPDVTPFCTVEMARKAWPELPKHRLNSLCDVFNIPLKHHNAVADATACAMLLLRCAEENKVSDTYELREILDEQTRKKVKADKAKRKDSTQKISNINQAESIMLPTQAQEKALLPNERMAEAN